MHQLPWTFRFCWGIFCQEVREDGPSLFHPLAAIHAQFVPMAEVVGDIIKVPIDVEVCFAFAREAFDDTPINEQLTALASTGETELGSVSIFCLMGPAQVSSLSKFRLEGYVEVPPEDGAYQRSIKISLQKDETQLGVIELPVRINLTLPITDN